MQRQGHRVLTRPNTVCLLSSQGVGTVVIKNWLPLVLGPAWAILRVKGRSCRKLRSNSSWKCCPQMDWPPVPSPVSSSAALNSLVPECPLVACNTASLAQCLLYACPLCAAMDNIHTCATSYSTTTGFGQAASNSGWLVCEHIRQPPLPPVLQ